MAKPPSEANDYVINSISSSINRATQYRDYFRELDLSKNYYSFTLTVPAKKLITYKSYNRIEYSRLPPDIQESYLLYLLKVSLRMYCNEIYGIYEMTIADYVGKSFEFSIHKVAFEKHPNRINGLHLHALLSFNDIFEEFIALEILKRISEIKLVHKICKYERLRSEKDIVRWINYLEKDVLPRPQLVMTEEEFDDFQNNFKNI